MAADSELHPDVRKYRKHMLRLGTVVLTAGFGMALAAAFVMGRQGNAVDPGAIAFHRLALVVMLVGFCVVLGSSRLPQLLAPPAAGSPSGSPVASARPRSGWVASQLDFWLGSGLAGGAAFSLLLPPYAGATVTILLACLLPFVVLAMIVGTRGGRRAFYLGAIIPGVLVQLVGMFLLLALRWHLASAADVRLCQVGMAVGWALMLPAGLLAAVAYAAVHGPSRRHPD